MEKLEDTEFDVIILGTGVTESILAGALARVGKKVLHLDKNDFYGGYNACFTLQAFEKILADSSVNVNNQTNSNSNGKEEISTFSPEEQNPSIKLFNCESTFIDFTKEVTAEISSTKELKSEEAEIASESTPEPKKEVKTIVYNKEKILNESRNYNVDLLPKMQFSSGPETELLIQSGVARYLEFRPLDSLYMFYDNELQSVPCSKSDVFKNKQLSLIEKRQLSKFITLIQNDLEGGSNEEEGEKQEPVKKEGNFIDFLKTQGLSQKLSSFVLYAISLLDEDQSNSEHPISTVKGFELMKRFVSSLGRYGNSPIICSLYGYSELCQAYCRLCAVYGGIYMLRKPLQKITLEDSTYRNIIDTDGTQYNSPFLVVSADYAAPYLEKESSSFISRSVVISDASLREGEHQILISIPPGVLGNKYAIHIVQYNSDMFVCPKGKYLIHFVTKATETAKKDLEKAVHSLFKTDTNSNSTLPLALYIAYFNQASRVPKTSGIPKNMFVCRDPTFELDNDAHVAEARSIFFNLFPTEKFLPRAHNEDDFVWEEESSPQQTETSTQSKTENNQ